CMIRCMTASGMMVATVLAAGCGQTGDSRSLGAPPAVASSGPDTAKLLLKDEPAGATGVAALRKQAKDGAEVVVLGRIGGGAKPFTSGRLAFLLADAELPVEDSCSCPWDFCEVPKEVLKASVVHVKFLDEGGKTVSGDAPKVLGVKELSTVVV